MNLNNQNIIREIKRKLSIARIRLMTYHPFFGMMLMKLNFNLFSDNDSHKLIATNGKDLYFNEQISFIDDSDLDFIIMHEIMHIALNHPFRRADRVSKLFNLAADIVVNSILLQHLKKDIVIIDNQEVPHLAPNHQEGYLYSVEEIYEMLINENKNKANGDSNSFDSHQLWGMIKESISERETRENEILTLYEFAKSAGTEIACLEIKLNNLRHPKLDWRIILNNFIQFNLCDYSFSPPDNRYQNSDFILPSFNDVEEEINDILFMVDVSSSMSDQEITDCYSEIKGAIDQFNGKVRGFIGFFDTVVKNVYAFDESVDIVKFKINGRGGTDVRSVFNYIKEMNDNIPKLLIILTDGYVIYWPKKEDIPKISVLWVINNEKITPPFGDIARI